MQSELSNPKETPKQKPLVNPKIFLTLRQIPLVNRKIFLNLMQLTYLKSSNFSKFSRQTLWNFNFINQTKLFQLAALSLIMRSFAQEFLNSLAPILSTNIIWIHKFYVCLFVQVTIEALFGLKTWLPRNSNCAALQTNRIVKTSNLRKINNSLKKASIFRNLEVFQILREVSNSTWERKNKASGQMCPDFVQRG